MMFDVAVGLRRGSAAAGLLGLRVRIPPGAWMSVLTVVSFQVEVSATGGSLVLCSSQDPLGLSNHGRGKLVKLTLDQRLCHR